CRDGVGGIWGLAFFCSGHSDRTGNKVPAATSIDGQVDQGPAHVRLGSAESPRPVSCQAQQGRLQSVFRLTLIRNEQARVPKQMVTALTNE
ncbi:MAG: hypothetical protein QOD91_1278, partial [Frankiales bacterium]|nr:hypothetical protein [Frankiales bacterium]